MSRPVRIATVTPLEGFQVQLEFTDRTTKAIDLHPYLHGPIFDPIKNDLRVFRAVKVDTRMGTIVWDNGADIDPDVLYKGLPPAWMEEEQTIEEDKTVQAV